MNNHEAMQDHCDAHKDAAFPMVFYRDNLIGTVPGLSRREYFAGLAMQGLLSTITINRDDVRPFIVRSAVAYADALLEELNKPLEETK